MLDPVLMAHCQPTGNLGYGIFNRRLVLRPCGEGETRLSLRAFIAQHEYRGNEKMPPARR